VTTDPRAGRGGLPMSEWSPRTWLTVTFQRMPSLRLFAWSPNLTAWPDPTNYGYPKHCYLNSEIAITVCPRLPRTRLFYSSGDTHVRQLVEEALFHTEHLTQGLADHTTSAPALPDQNTRPA
jgi:hypothetical protein